MTTLRDRVQELITSTEWAEHKQQQWLEKHGESSWDSCHEDTLREAIKKLEVFDRMFPSVRVDKSSEKPENKGDGLRVYGEGG